MPAPLLTSAAYAGNFTGLLKRAQSEQRQKKLAWALAFETRRDAMINAHAQYGSYRDVVADLGESSAEGVKAKLRKLEADLRKKLECPICYEVMDPRITNNRHKGYVVYFNCGHAACTECALTLRDRCENATCPLCRATINGSLRDLQPPLPGAEPQLCELTPAPHLLEELTHDNADDSRTFPFPKGTCYLCPNEFQRGAVVKKHCSLTGKVVCCACAEKPVPPCNRCGQPCNHHDTSGGTTLRNTLKSDDGTPAWSYTCGPCIQAQCEESGSKGLPSGAAALLKRMGPKAASSTSAGAKRRRSA